MLFRVFFSYFLYHCTPKQICMKLLKLYSLFVILLLASGLSSCTGYLKDADIHAEQLKVSEAYFVLNNKTSYAEVFILNGTGSYHAECSNPHVVQTILKGNRLYILGMEYGDVSIKVWDAKDPDCIPVEILVNVTESIPRIHYAEQIIYVKKGEQRLLHPSFPSDTYTWETEDKAVASVRVTTEGYVLKGSKTGITAISVSKEYWVVQPYIVVVVDQYPLILSDYVFSWSATAEELEQGLDIPMGLMVKVGYGKYEISSTDEDIVSPSIHQISIDTDTDELYNPAYIFFKTRKIGNTTVTVTDLTTGEQATIYVNIKLKT